MNEYKDTNEWMQKIMAASQANAKPIEESEQKQVHKSDNSISSTPVQTNSARKKLNKTALFLGILIFVIALLPRLYFLYSVSDPQNPGDGWAGDTFHHWQIAYLTREIGLSTSFMRLWDLKGMEYFWGPLHPLLMILMFSITNSVSIVNARLLSLIFGSLIIMLLFLIGAKYWNKSVGLAAAFLAITHPVGILDDTFGMVEPIAYFLLLLGVLILEEASWLAGILWALSAYARAEGWMYGGLLVVLSWRILRKSGQKTGLLISYLVMMAIYVKYLLDKTGNPIYPVWWNYLANAKGVWATAIIYTDYQLWIKPYLIVWFVISSLIFLFVLWIFWWKKRSISSSFLLFGFANWAFIGGFMGLTHYLTGFQPWFWFIRFFEYPYLFLGCVIAILLFYTLPKYVPIFKNFFLLQLLWIPVVVIAVFYQILFWGPIMAKYNSTRPTWKETQARAAFFMKPYDGGKALLPEGEPNLTYAMVYNDGLEGKNIIGQMFDPYFYMSGDPYVNWSKNRKVVLGWIKKQDIKWIFTYSDRQRYIELFKREPQYFQFIADRGRDIVYRAYPDRIPENIDAQ